MKIAFFTEGNYTGKVSRDIDMRTDQAWVCALEAYLKKKAENI